MNNPTTGDYNPENIKQIFFETIKNTNEE